MSESSEHTTETTPVVTTEPADPVIVERKPNRLYQAAAWVGIVAGTVFVVAMIFFSGFVLGKNVGGDGHFGRHGETSMFERQGPGMHRDGPDRPGMMWPGGPGGPGQGPGAPQTPPTR